MNTQQTAELLAYIRIIEPRQELDEATVLRWQKLLDDVDFRVAIEAVDLHDRDTAAWIKPAHIRTQVDRIMLAAAGPHEDEWGNTIEPDRAAVAAWRRAQQQRAVTA